MFTLSNSTKQELIFFYNFIYTDKYKKPLFLEEPATQVFLVEGNGTLACHLQSPPNIPIAVEWKKDYHELSKELVKLHFDNDVLCDSKAVHNLLLMVESSNQRLKRRIVWGQMAELKSSQS